MTDVESRLLGMLERIATASERAAAAQERIAGAVDEMQRIAETMRDAFAQVPDEPVQPTACQHPPDRRIDFGMTGGRPDWQCKDCNFRSISETT